MIFDGGVKSTIILIFFINYPTRPKEDTYEQAKCRYASINPNSMG